MSYPNTQSAYAQNPYAQPVGTPPPPVPVSTSPGLAFALGFIPGVGAIYNGQYLKGLVHALIFGLIISLLDAIHGPGAPLLAICLSAFVFYMPFEAYHTAKRRLAGQPVEEFSSLIAQNRFSTRDACRSHFADPDRRAVSVGHPEFGSISRRGKVLAGSADCGRSLYAL